MIWWSGVSHTDLRVVSSLGTVFSHLCLQGGVPPQPRAAHTCAVLGNKGYIFGGRVLVSVLNGNGIFTCDSSYKKLFSDSGEQLTIQII